MKIALPANRNVRQRLKNETSKIHKRLDDSLSTRGLFNSLENYRWYLCGMYALYRHCDSSIRWAQVQAGLETRAACLFELIELDLATFGVSAPAFESTNVDHDQATRWAQAYVMEGSAVGASFMIRGAKKSWVMTWASIF
jgi:heme oxygenase